LTLDVLIFQVAQHRCGIACAQTSEILPMAATFQVPGQPPILHGFLNLRGTIVPLVFLRRLLALPAGPLEEYTSIIVVKARDQSLALVVDRVLEVEHFARSQVTALEVDHSLNDFADDYVQRGENSFTLLNVERLLLSEERERLQELSVEARRRLDEIEASRR
jgi:purine-binding chemotaxis protein CheW